ncbi:sulfatase family protein [Lutibacter citreus]|uniref:sulfatase family protein n=1 Tax=Lutibacter citreus TaxID=2138210 RepID=UPI000DBE8192|nr:sulfatase-like hydrolase/transferase [Lutibacter citreus]
MNKILLKLFILLLVINVSCKPEKIKNPNVLFIMMDDLGYGQFGVNNDTITTKDFNPYFVHLVDSLQGYSLEKSLEFSKKAIPTLTQLAKTGIIFNKAYTTSNVCGPSRLGIATGTNQNRFGVYTNEDCEKDGLVPGTHLAETIKKLDYTTAHIGKWHIGRKNFTMISDLLKENGLDDSVNMYYLRTTHPKLYKQLNNLGFNGSVSNEQHPLKNGFDYYFGYNHWSSDYYNSKKVWEDYKYNGQQKGYNTDVFTDKTIAFMDKSFSKEKPFYIQLHYHAVHDSIEPQAPDKYYKKFNSKSKHLNNFYAHINGVDENVKRIVSFLKSKKEYENTIIVFTSDNGAMAGGSYDGNKTGSPLPANTPFKGHKGNFYQGGFRVPFFVHWPKEIKKAEVSSQLISTMDILPTVIDIAGGEIPNNIDGKSLKTIFKNESKGKIHDYLIWSGVQAYKWGYLINKSAKTHNTEAKFAPPAWVVIQDDYLLRYTGILEKGVYLDFMDGREAIIELYNIKNDPGELNNIADSNPEIIKELSNKYFRDSKSFPLPADWEKSKWEELRDTSEF